MYFVYKSWRSCPDTTQFVTDWCHFYSGAIRGGRSELCQCTWRYCLQRVLRTTPKANFSHNLQPKDVKGALYLIGISENLSEWIIIMLFFLQAVRYQTTHWTSRRCWSLKFSILNGVFFAAITKEISAINLPYRLGLNYLMISHPDYGSMCRSISRPNHHQPARIHCCSKVLNITG